MLYKAHRLHKNCTHVILIYMYIINKIDDSVQNKIWSMILEVIVQDARNYWIYMPLKHDIRSVCTFIK